MKKIALEIDGKLVTGSAAINESEIWVHLNGETYTVEAVDTKLSNQRRRKQANVKIKSGDLVAPMPGKIIKLSASIGESVKEGQTLLVMEAMKMEYTIKATMNGKLIAILVNPGDQVALGQNLIHIEPT